MIEKEVERFCEQVENTNDQRNLFNDLKIFLRTVDPSIRDAVYNEIVEKYF